MKKKFYKNAVKSLTQHVKNLEEIINNDKIKIDQISKEFGQNKAVLYDKETELNETLKAFDEIRDELTYFKGFHDGVKNGAKVNFSPTINQQPKKEYASGGIIGKRCEKHAGDEMSIDDRCENQKRDEREFCKPMEPCPETVEKVLSFSERMKNFDYNVDKLKTENLNKESETQKSGLLKFIFESFIGSDAKGLVICKGEPSSEDLEEIKSAIAEVQKMDDEVTKRGDGTTACNPK